jgi:hypothetical protein
MLAMCGQINPAISFGAAPHAVRSRPLPAITSSKVGSPAAKPVWPKQAAMDSFYGPKGTGQATLLLPFVMRIASR